LKSSEDSLPSKQRDAGGVLLACAVLAMIVFFAAWWVFRNGYVLYYGDAQSHLNLSRSIIDSRTPGYDQLGTVWLPMLHFICLPLVSNTEMWSTGLGGTIPVACCFVIAGAALFMCARETYRSRAAAWIVIGCLALNPNVLYLATIPMTEIVFLAGLTVLLLALVRFEKTQRPGWLVLGVAASWWMSLTRYDGWFLIPFTGLWFAWSAKQRFWRTLLVFGCAASLAPLYWMAHNWWQTSNPLDFYNGPYSAIAIQGNRPYPGYHDWPVAARYYAKAGQLCGGWPLLLLGVVGLIAAIRSRKYRPVLFLLLTPAFYIWSIHSSQNPIFVPQLWPHGYYNSRYGIAVVVFAALACGALADMIPSRWARFAVAIPALSVLPWIVRPSQENWICWKESLVNSNSRRAWTQAAAEFMRANYAAGQGILTPSASGDLAGIFCRASIPLKETLNIGNGPAWLLTTTRPDLMHPELWAIGQEGDSVSKALSGSASPYRLAEELKEKDASTVQIFRRADK
jgi:hypothetical protein